MDGARKFFCLSFQKSGTTSLHGLFRAMGFERCELRNVNGVDYLERLRPLVGNHAAILAELKPAIAPFRTFANGPYPGIYRELAAEYPDARFILLTRDPAAWWNSLHTHWSLGTMRHQMTPFERIQYQDYLPRDLEIAGAAHRDLFISAYERHVAAVEGFFSPDRLLSLALTDTDKSRKICSFMEVPHCEFPHVKQTDFRRRARRFLKNWRHYRPGQAPAKGSHARQGDG
jgi:hypothetical protein